MKTGLAIVSSPSMMLSATVRTGTSMKCWWTMLMPRAIASDGPAICTGVPVEQDLALVRHGQAVEDVHQCRLAGAVLAEQGVDLARSDVEVDVVVGDHARIALRDAVHLERGRAGGARWGRRGREPVSPSRSSPRNGLSETRRAAGFMQTARRRRHSMAERSGWLTPAAER